MKKIFALVCSALLIGFSSCSSDDEMDNSLQFPSKKLTKIEVYDDNKELALIETFTYDNQGRWIKSEYDLKQWNSTDPSYEPEIRTETLTYSNDKIIFTDAIYADKEVFTVKDNRIVSRYTTGYEEDVDTYHYSNGYLVKIGEDYADFEYTNGNLTKSKEYQTYTITYTNIPDKLGFSIFEASYNDGAINVYPNNPLYQFGYFGKRSKNLIESINSNYSPLDGYSYSYELDKDGYVSEMKKRRTSGGYETYKFFYQ